MRTIRFILQKEFKQIFRNKSMLPMIFGMPLMQLLLLSSALTYEIKNLNVHIVDQDKSTTSRELIDKFRRSGYFTLVHYSEAVKPAKDDLLRNKADFALIIPPRFEKDLYRQNFNKIQLLINAINTGKTSVISAYSSQVIAGFHKNLQIQLAKSTSPGVLPQTLADSKQINLISRHWFNPTLNYYNYMIPGLLVVLVTMIGMFLSSMNIVKEREIGTIEQLNVTPIRKHQFLIGKLLPFWIIGIFELVFGLLLGLLVFDIPMVGSPFLIFGFASVYLLVVLGMGLLISTFTDTQQQAVFLAWFCMVIFILMSGLFTTIESMPYRAQEFTRFNPIAYFNQVIRLIMLKGAGFAEIQTHFIILCIYAVSLLGLAFFRYKKTN